MLVSAIINGESNSLNFANLSPNDIAAYRFAPITNVSVERSFSKYKSILTSQRRQFTMENLKMYVVTYVNSLENSSDDVLSQDVQVDSDESSISDDEITID